MQIDDQEYKNQIMRTNKTSMPLEQITSESSDSIQSEEDEVIPKIEYQADDPVDDYYQMVQNVILKRDQIEYLLMLHYYNNIIEGSFVRIHEPQLKRYVLAQILAIVEGESSYKLGQTQTHKLLKLQLAQIKDPTLRHITHISNQKVEKQEYAVWKKDSETNGLKLPSKDFLSRKFKDIQGYKSKMDDEQRKKKIIQTIDIWSKTNNKEIILYHDLPVYLNFMLNQIQTAHALIHKFEEQIQEIQESGGADIAAEDTSKIISSKRSIQEKHDEVRYLEMEVTKIKALLKHHNEREVLKQQKNQQQPESKQQRQIKLQQKDDTLNKQNQAYQKEMDSQYKKKYEGISNFQNSEHFKQQFLDMHNRDLEIDSIIDEQFMNVEE